MKLGKQILEGMAAIFVAEDREGYYFTFKEGDTRHKIRLLEHAGGWKYNLPGETRVRLAQFSDPPKKPHP